ncbi:MAG: C25 family cysteine peptidase [Candidatus Contendobacter sp.]|nr:C25 family cysteine peptidase [Candidatus Contendobacter sp.]
MSTLTTYFASARGWRLIGPALALGLLLLLALLARPAAASCGGVTPVGTESALNSAIAAYNAVTTAPCVFTIQLTANINLTASTTGIQNGTNNTGVRLVIEGAGNTVNGQNTSGVRPFSLASSNRRRVRFNQITITGGYVPGQAGGGIESQGGTLRVTNSTITGNHADTGGGISNCSTNCELILENSTISGNRADSSYGGGIRVGGTATIDSSTIVDNQACSACGGALAVTSGNATVTNSILANSTDGSSNVPDCAFPVGGATVTDGGYNLVQDPGRCSFTNGVNNNIVGQDPQLDSLASNGGPTQTHALLPGSPAIDAGSTTLTTDQRGVDRPQGAADDIGAYEVGPPAGDYGDAPSGGTVVGGVARNYGAPSHLIPASSVLRLGSTSTDSELGLQGTVGANGDDNTGVDDETGVILTTRFGNVTARVTVESGSGSFGTLCGWVDGSNGGGLNGSFDPAEGQCVDPATSCGANSAFSRTCDLTFDVSTLSAGSISYARFRVSTDTLTTASGGAGTASDGEVEDYRVPIQDLDAGDAPGTLGSPVTVAGVARSYSIATHVLSPNLYLGAVAPDADATDLSNATADGDDTTNTDDEEGVALAYTPDGVVTAVVTVTNDTGAAVSLAGWIDGANSINGAFGFNERKTATVPASGNTADCQEISASPRRFRCTLSWTSGQLSALAPGVVTFARFRVSTATLNPTGAEPDGEVEDYRIDIAGDFGDAPASYGDPSHTIQASPLLYLGAVAPDGESNSQHGSAANNDDNNGTDDEDGVTFSTPAGGGANVIANVTVTNNTGGAVTLCGWLDADTSNAFDPGEQRCVTVTAAGATTVALPEWLVSSTTTQNYYARFRVCSTAAQCNVPTGGASDGEVEDYRITYNPTLATVGSFEVKPTRVDSVLSALAGKNGDPAALRALLAAWDPELAKRLEGADAETLAAALRHYLDPDGDGQVAVVRWDTLQEHGTVGFYAERAEGDGWTRLNGGLLPGLIDAPQGGEYWLFDPEVTSGAHRYRLVELEAWGSERLHGPWTVQISPISTASARTPAQATPPSADAEDADRWSDWRGLAQGFVARKRVPPPPPVQPLAASATPQAATAPTGALWLRTQAEGLYRIPTAQLATLLGDKEDQVRKWLSKDKKLALVNAGAPVPWYYDAASDALYFVAQEYRTLHTNHNAYRLAKDNAPSLTMAERTGAGPAAGSPAGTFRETLRLEQDETFSLWSIKDDTEADYWFWDYLYAGTTHDAVTVPLALPGAATSGQGQLRIHLRGWTDFEPGNDHRVSATLNGTALGVLEWDGFTTAVLTVPFDQALLANGNTLKLLSQKINAAATNNPGQWLDRIEAAYQREPKAENGQLWLHGLAAGAHTVAGFASNAIQVIEAPATTQAVWRRDVTIASAGSGWQVSFNAPQGGDFLVVDGTALRTPTAEIDATSTLAKANNRADYLIVAPRALAQTANALAGYRAGNNRKVEIAWLDDIYDEFSFGRTDPRAISDFLTYVYRNWKRVPEYVVLLGNGTLDHRNRKGYGDSLLPVRMMMSPWGLLVSDHRYVDINGDGRSEYAFGRIPATTDAQGLAYVQKVQSATPAPRRAVVVADNPDSGGDFHANAARQAKELQGLLGRDKVTTFYHPTDAVRTALTNSATWEAAYLSYDGHGSALQLGNNSENFLKPDDAPALRNSALPVFVALTCEAGNGAVPGWGGSVAGALALNPNGGALAALAPTGVSLDADAQGIGSAFADYLLGGRLSVGQAAREAQMQSAGRVAPFMLGIYQILGDPAAQLP